jgi:hypothetical protein
MSKLVEIMKVYFSALKMNLSQTKEIDTISNI